MTNKLQKIEKEIANLPLKQRAKLASIVLDGLEKTTPAELEQIQKQEIRRRSQGIKNGEMKLINADKVHKGIRANLQNLRQKRK